MYKQSDNKRIKKCRLELLTRDNTDSNKINITEKEDKSKGKFYTLLKFRANAANSILKNCLGNEAANTQFTSANTQNVLIKICGQINH